MKSIRNPVRRALAAMRSEPHAAGPGAPPPPSDLARDAPTRDESQVTQLKAEVARLSTVFDSLQKDYQERILELQFNVRALEIMVLTQEERRETDDE